MTPSERKRAVEVMVMVMARSMFDQEYWNETDGSRDRMWARVSKSGNRWKERANAALTALLRIADVKMKDQADDR